MRGILECIQTISDLLNLVALLCLSKKQPPQNLWNRNPAGGQPLNQLNEGSSEGCIKFARKFGVIKISWRLLR